MFPAVFGLLQSAEQLPQDGWTHRGAGVPVSPEHRDGDCALPQDSSGGAGDKAQPGVSLQSPGDRAQGCVCTHGDISIPPTLGLWGKLSMEVFSRPPGFISWPLFTVHQTLQSLHTSGLTSFREWREQFFLSNKTEFPPFAPKPEEPQELKHWFDQFGGFGQQQWWELGVLVRREGARGVLLHPIPVFGVGLVSFGVWDTLLCFPKAIQVVISPASVPALCKGWAVGRAGSVGRAGRVGRAGSVGSLAWHCALVLLRAGDGLSAPPWAS